MSDALDRLRQRTRPKVPPRDTSLTSLAPKHQDTQTSGPLDIQTPGQPDNQGIPDIQTSRHTDPSNAGSQDNTTAPQDISKSRHIDTKTSKPSGDELQTKRSTFRLETDLIERLHTFCRRQGLSREVLIEAMYEYMETHPEAMDQVVAAASEKNEYRQQLANRKRAAAMMSKFGGSGA